MGTSGDAINFWKLIVGKSSNRSWGIFHYMNIFRIYSGAACWHSLGYLSLRWDTWGLSRENCSYLTATPPHVIYVMLNKRSHPNDALDQTNYLA